MKFELKMKAKILLIFSFNRVICNEIPKFASKFIDPVMEVEKSSEVNF